MNLRIKAITRAITAAIIGLAMMLSALSTAAQGYTFAPETVTFESIRNNGGTVVGLNPRDNDRDNGTYLPIEIGFEFEFFGRPITTLVPTTNLWISANPDYLCESSDCNLASESSLNDASNLAGFYLFWSDASIATRSEVLWQRSGAEGNRVLTIEYWNFGTTQSISSNRINFQLKLFEANGDVEFLYGRVSDFVDIESLRRDVFVGISASATFLPDSDIARYYSLDGLSNSADASDTEFTHIPRSRTPPYPAVGQSFRFSPTVYFFPAPPNLTVVVSTLETVVLPELQNPVGEVSYALDLTNLPPGTTFAFSDSSRTLTGMSVSSFPPTTLTYTATDNLNNEDESDDVIRTRLFTLEVIPNDADFGDQDIEDIVAFTNREIMRTLPEVVRGVTPITYTLTPDLPMGLTFVPGTRVLSGIPTAVFPTTTYTYTATDSTRPTPTTDTIMFTITVNNNLPVFPNDAPDSSFSEFFNVQINPVILPAAMDGDPTVRYSLTPFLPTGLTFDPTDREISGTPLAVTPPEGTEYTYIATDGNGDTAIRMFTITVRRNVPDLSGATPIDAIVLTAGVPRDRVVDLPAAVGGDLPVRYTLTPDLPQGLVFDNMSTSPTYRRISGTPAAITPEATYTYSAIDADGDVAPTMLMFTIEVEANIVVTWPEETPGNSVLGYRVDGPALNITFPDLISEGNGGLQFETRFEDPANTPSWFTLSEERSYSVTPPSDDSTDQNDSFVVRRTATDRDSDSDTFDFTVNLTDGIPELVDDHPPITVTAGVMSDARVMPFTGGDGTTIYALKAGNTLPTGLMFNADRTITGSITDGNGNDSMGVETYTYTATDSGGEGDMREATFDLTIEDAIPIPPMERQVSLELNADATTDPLPVFTSDTIHSPTFDYSVSGLPPGFTYNNDRTISGRATLGGSATFMYTATDGADEVSIPFTLVFGTAPAFADDATVMNINAVAGTPFNTVALPQAINHEAGFVYSIPDLPTGLVGLDFDPATRVLSGTIGTNTDDNGTTTYNYTVTNGNLNATIPFDITVVDALPEITATSASVDITDGEEFDIRTVHQSIDLAFTVTQGTGTHTLALTPAGELPDGINYSDDINSLTISGTPQSLATLSRTEFTLSLTDADGDEASFSFFLTVRENSVPRPPTQGLALHLTPGVSFTEELPAFIGGNPPVTYSLSPLNQPNALRTESFRATDLNGNPSRTFSGSTIPDTDGASQSRTIEYTLTATDVDGDDASATFTVNVYDTRPSVPEPTTAGEPFIADKRFHEGEDIEAFELPVFMDNIPEGVTLSTSQLVQGASRFTGFTYTITGLPPGLVATGRTISGNPNMTGPFSVTYTATDTASHENYVGEMAETTFTITILVGTPPNVPDPPIMDIVFEPGQVVNEILPAFTGGNPPLMYSLYDGTNTNENLVYGLTFNPDPATRTITGMTPAGDSEINSMPAVTFTYSATDSDTEDTPEPIPVTFTIAIVDSVPMAPDKQDLTIAVSNEVTTQSLMPFTGGTGGADMLVYAFTDTLPTGLEFGVNPSSNIPEIMGNFVGIPNADDTTTGEPPSYTFTATDRDGDVREATFTVAITDAVPEFTTPTIDPITIIQNSDYPDNPLPMASPGTGELTYSVVDSDGNPPNATLLGFNEDSRRLTGNPTAAAGTYNLVYRVEDQVGDTDTIDFVVTVVADESPVAPTDPQDFIFVPGQTVDATNGTLEAFTMGNRGPSDAPLTYTLEATPALPTPLEFNNTTRVLEGMLPDDVAGNSTIDLMTHTYAATDVDGDSVTAMFTIRVVDDYPIAPPTVNIPPLLLNEPIPENTVLPAFTTNVDDIDAIPNPMPDYTVTGLPNGVMFEETTALTLSGMPTQEGDFTVTYTATLGPDVVPTSFTLTVDNDLKPIAPTISNLVLTPLQEVNVQLEVFTGGDGTLSYSLSDGTNTDDSLMFGLSFDPDPTVRRITGMVPRDAVHNRNAVFTYTATDDDGSPNDQTDDDPVSIPFTITINDAMPAFATGARIANISGTQRTAITTVELPAVADATPGTGTITYSLSPTLPTGLTFAPDADPRTISGTPSVSFPTTNFTYTATDIDGDIATIPFTITIESDVETAPMAPTIPGGGYTFNAGDDLTADPTELPAFDGGNGDLTYSLSPAFPDDLGLSFNPNSREITGTVRETNGNDSVDATEYTYTATDEDGDNAMVTFTITITDEDNPVAPAETQAFRFEPGQEDIRITLMPFTGGSGTLTYMLESTPDLPGTLAFTPSTRVIAGMIPESVGKIPEATYTYRATAANGETNTTTFTIVVTDAPSLAAATAIAIPTVGANIALVASQAISTRVELALAGLSQGWDIRPLEGPQLRLNPSANQSQQNGGSSGSPVRFGVWYSAASDSLSDTHSTVTWEGTTDSTNLGLDVGFDISESASVVVGILQNSSSTSANYRNTNRENSETLSVDLDSTAFYVGLGYDWLDAWFADGSADSFLNDSQTEMAIPVSFSFQTIGLTAAFEVAESFNIGGKVESLTSDLSLAAMENGYAGLQTDSTQLRTSFVANYQLKLGEKGNGLLIPKLEFGLRDLSIGTSITEEAVAAFAAVGGSAMETGFGIDYLQIAWGFTLGIDIRSISVENYSSDSTQWQVRWESGDYGSGISFQLTPHSVSETLGGIDSLYSGDYDQYQNLLQRQRGGGDDAADTKGIDFEMGYGFVAGYGTVTPYLKTTNYRGNGNRAQEFGIRYQTLSGLEVTLRAERSLTPQTIQILGFPLTFTQDESALTFNTRYSF